MYSEVLVSNFVQCYLLGSKNVEKNEGTCVISSHRANSTRTMLSHLLRYLKDHVHFEISESHLSVYIYIYTDSSDLKKEIWVFIMLKFSPLRKLLPCSKSRLKQ